MNQYPVGNLVICRFAFVMPPGLTPQQLAAFEAGQGLPSSVTPVTPHTVSFDFGLLDEEPSTVTGGAITVDAAGAYHYVVAATLPGLWRYRGYGVDASGNPVAATPKGIFQAVPF